MCRLVYKVYILVPKMYILVPKSTLPTVYIYTKNGTYYQYLKCMYQNGTY